MAKKLGDFSYDAAMQELQTLVSQLQTVSRKIAADRSRCK
jgi:exonuclease VII small subunit